MNSGLYVVMGVSGSGKSLIGAAFAHALKVDFIEGDTYHSAENVRRMAAGIPLTDADRAEWLVALAERIGESRHAGSGLVVTCSALKRSYRDILRFQADDLQFVFLKGEKNLIADRISNRQGHFMPASLLQSQLEILEEPSPDEHAWVYDIHGAPKDIVASLVARASA